MLETIVDRLVIRGDDPREPHASESWLKIRAVAVASIPALATLAIATALEVDNGLAGIAMLAMLVAGVKAVAGPINDRIEELEAADSEGN